jgi:16S rRNA processing protein RimM
LKAAELAPADRILVAQLGAAHGLRGEVRLRSFTAEPMAVKDYGPLESDDGQTFRIEALRPAKDILIARLAGIADRNAAERLRNLRLYVPRARLPAPEADEFYHADLIGLAAVAPDGRRLGTVVALQNFGAGDLVEVKLAGGATVLLPFTKAGVPEVDVAGGRVVVDLPESALDSGDGQNVRRHSRPTHRENPSRPGEGERSG